MFPRLIVVCLFMLSGCAVTVDQTDAGSDDPRHLWGRIQTDTHHVWLAAGEGIMHTGVDSHLHVLVHFSTPFTEPYGIQITGNNTLDGASIQYYYDPTASDDDHAAIEIADDSGNVFSPLSMAFDFTVVIDGQK